MYPIHSNKPLYLTVLIISFKLAASLRHREPPTKSARWSSRGTIAALPLRTPLMRSLIIIINWVRRKRRRLAGVWGHSSWRNRLNNRCVTHHLSWLANWARFTPHHSKIIEKMIMMELKSIRSNPKQTWVIRSLSRMKIEANSRISKRCSRKGESFYSSRDITRRSTTSTRSIITIAAILHSNRISRTIKYWWTRTSIALSSAAWIGKIRMVPAASSSLINPH